MVSTPIEVAEKFAEFLRVSLASDRFAVYSLAGDASSRRYYRIVHDEASYVLMYWDPFKDDGRYPFLNVLEHLAKHNVHVPKVIAKSPSQGLVLLEDLGDLTLERKFWEHQNQDLILPFYQMAIDEIIKIHYPASFDQPVGGADRRGGPGCVAFGIQFDTEKLLWEMNYGREHLLTGLCGLKFTPTEERALTDVFTKVCRELDNEPKFIAHRDYHSRNVMIKLGLARVIDFQDARMGAIQYDLVSLIRDSYVDIGESLASDIIEYYLAQRREFEKAGKVPSISRAHFDHIFEVQTVQRCFKACGSFASFYVLRKDTRYLKYLPRTLNTVRRSLEGFKEYKTFLQIMTDHGVFERKFDDL